MKELAHISDTTRYFRLDIWDIFFTLRVSSVFQDIVTLNTLNSNTAPTEEP